MQEGKEKGEDQSLEDGSGRGTQQKPSESNGASSNNEYKFTDGEAQLLRICIDAMHTAGLAFIVQGISTMMLGEDCLIQPQHACFYIESSPTLTADPSHQQGLLWRDAMHLAFIEQGLS